MNMRTNIQIIIYINMIIDIHIDYYIAKYWY